MTSKIVLIGKLQEYQSYFNLINSQIRNESITIVGMVLEGTQYKSLDNIPVYTSLSQVKDLKFDYFVLLNEDEEYFKTIPAEGFIQKTIPIRVFEIPYFNFSKYQQILENPPSIICRHCWGGLLYHTLGLQFRSPFINMFIMEADFNKLAKNFNHYMQQELVFLKEGHDPILNHNYPIVKLDDITIYFNHYTSFEEAKTKWEERKKRINYDNLFFETTTEEKNLALEFNSLQLPRKICFTRFNIDSPYIVNCQDLLLESQKGQLGMFVNGTATGEIPFFDILELLLNDNFDSRIMMPEVNDNERAFNHYKTTKMYKLEHDRFAGLDDTVPWELDDKLEAYNYIDKLGISHPKVLYKLDNMDDFKRLIRENRLPDNFCLKISNRSSCIGIMLLHKIGEDLYFDDLSSKSYSIDDIVNYQSQLNKRKSEKANQTYYFVEEKVDNFVSDMDIPVDYKVFCFNGVPKLIFQINRNVNHYTISLFDGNFIPLREGRDWFINPEMASLGVPVVPPSAYEILDQSMKISKEIGDKYVRIDWFDNGEEPVFGEFTFITGATFVGMFTLSEEILKNMDTSLSQEYYTDYVEKGYRINCNELQEVLDTSLDFKSCEYFALLKKCSIGNLEAIEEMGKYFESLAVNEGDAVKRRLYQHLEICWYETLLNYKELTTEKLCRSIHAGKGFIFLKTQYYPQRILEAKNALYDTGVKSDWYKIRWAQFILDFGVDDEEILKSKELVKKYSEDGMDYAVAVKNKYNI